jgi:hypothetical protein
MVCAIPAGHRLSTLSVITPPDLHAQAMIMQAKRNPVRPIIDRIFSKMMNAPKNVVFREFSPEMLYETSFFTSGSTVPSAIAQKYMEYVRKHQPATMFKTEAVT